MGLIQNLASLLFGNEVAPLRDTVELFHENAEASAVRSARQREAALGQFSREFTQSERGLFDRMMDAANRLPRPALALGTLGLFVSAMIDPVWFAARMQGIALVPEPLWWLMGAIVSFYFGARHQAKSQDFQRQVARVLTVAPQVLAARSALDALQRGAQTPMAADPGHDADISLHATEPTENPALDAWKLSQGGER